MVIIYVWMYTTDKFQNSLGAGGCVRLWRWCESTCTERAGVGWWGFADFEVYEVCGTVHRDTTPVLTLCTPKSHPRHLTQTCLKTPCWNFLLLLTYLESESMFDLWFLSLCLLYASKQSRHLYGLVESPSKISNTPQNTSCPKIAPEVSPITKADSCVHISWILRDFWPGLARHRPVTGCWARLRVGGGCTIRTVKPRQLVLSLLQNWPRASDVCFAMYNVHATGSQWIRKLLNSVFATGMNMHSVQWCVLTW